MNNEHIHKNKIAWNDKARYHYDSSFYDVEGFLQGKNSLNEIELSLLEDIKDKTVLHLQCHFGMDSISLSRMGADVTGVDFSETAIALAEELAQKAGADTSFICCNLFDFPKYADKQYDIVFTSYGTIGWFPDIVKWVEVIHNSLKQGGKFVFADFHPVLWMFDDDFEKIIYPYHKDEPIIEKVAGTYADRNAPLNTETITWNHSIAEVLGNLIKGGFEITAFEEYDYSPYDCFKNTEQFETGKYRIKHLGNKIPMLYAFSAVKK